jgi:exopolysaccharide biosynthesis WecB/TagA/CpsF family protein
VAPGAVQVELAGSLVHLMEQDAAITTIIDRAAESWARPLAVVSANLDHVHHFGHGSRWQETFDQLCTTGDVDVLTLLDGMPLVHQANRLTGGSWPRLAGSDLIAPLLDAAEAAGLSVGFLGGMPDSQATLARVLADERPGLEVAGMWAPERAVLTDADASRALAGEIADAGVDLLAVCLGKPLQELWIAEHGAATGAGALLAFGAVVDFLAGEIDRAPAWASEHGLEWAHRLAREPRRLARRYLVQGPPAYRALRRHSSTLDDGAAGRAGRAPVRRPQPTPEDQASTPAFDVTAIVVTHNSGGHVTGLLDSLRLGAGDLRVRLVAVDNDSTDDTVTLLAAQPDVEVIHAPGNLGYAAAINLAMEQVESEGQSATTRSILVLNPDLRLEHGALRAMWDRLWRPGVGAVAPRLTDLAGSLDHSLHFEPGPLRTLGDSLLGARAAGRPTWATEMDWDPESYRHAHPVEWATGACLLVRRTVTHHVGAWDERYFLYSEEVDYQRRVRESGWSVWFEPTARAMHVGGGSGSSPELEALLAINRVRYVDLAYGRARGDLVRAAALLGELLRSPRGRGHRRAAWYLASRRRWSGLPAGVSAAAREQSPRRRTAA